MIFLMHPLSIVFCNKKNASRHSTNLLLLLMIPWPLLLTAANFTIETRIIPLMRSLFLVLSVMLTIFAIIARFLATLLIVVSSYMVIHLPQGVPLIRKLQ